MVCRPGLTIPVLIRMEFNAGSMIPKSLAAAAYVNDQWIDLGEILKLSVDPEALTQLDDGKGALSFFENSLENLKTLIDLFTMRDKIFFRIEGGTSTEIPDAGIENLTVLGEEMIDHMFEIFEASAEAENGETGETYIDAAEGTEAEGTEAEGTEAE